MASCIGNRIQIKVDDGDYGGILQAIDNTYGRLTIKDVTNIESGSKLKGLMHFFRKEIHNIVVVEEKKKSKAITEDTRNGRSLLSQKFSPSHLKNLKDVERDKLFLSGKSSGDERDGEQAETIRHTPADKHKTVEVGKAPSVGPYTVIDTLDDSFTEAVEHLKTQNILGISAKGVNLGRNGQLCWLCLHTKAYTLLFDVVSLGEEGITEKGLGEVLQSHRIQKVIHDCRLLSDLLFHQYNIKMVNVFDTQVAEAVTRHTQTGDWPSFVSGLSTHLFQFLNLKPELVHIDRFREEKDDCKVWTVRPAGLDCLEALAKSVIFLLELRLELMEMMMSDFTHGVDIYLNCIREVTSQDEFLALQNSPHRLPKEFRDVGRQNGMTKKRRDPSMFDENGFFENCDGVMDPLVKFSHDGVWHKGDGTQVVPKSKSMATNDGRRRSRSASRNDGQSGRSHSRGRPSGKSSDEETSILKAGADELAKMRTKNQPQSQIFQEQPEGLDTPSLFPRSPISPKSMNAADVLKENRINLIASGNEAHVGLPKLADRVRDPVRKPTGADSGGEFDIISTYAVDYDKPQIHSRLPRVAKTSGINTQAQEQDPIPDRPSTGLLAAKQTLPRSSPEAPLSQGRGQYIRNIQKTMLGSGTPTTSAPGGLQSRLPKCAGTQSHHQLNTSNT